MHALIQVCHCLDFHSSVPLTSVAYLYADMNRETVIARKSLPIIIGQLQHTTLANLAIPVLYNICFDYGDVQTPGSTVKSLIWFQNQRSKR